MAKTTDGTSVSNQTPRTLYLHVGHRKTGSSYIQYCLATSKSLLRKAGIDYPIQEETLQKAIQRQPTAGNGLELAQALKRGDLQVVRNHMQPTGSPATLFSAEKLLSSLSAPRGADLLFSEAVDAGVDRISILLFIRDPVEHVVSAYGQDVKRHYGNFDINIDDYFAAYNQPAKVLAALEAFQRWPDLVSTEVHNYSRCTEDLADLCFRWLGFGVVGARGAPPPLPAAGPSRTVNRSLSVAEFEFCEALLELGVRPNRLSDALVTTLPEIKSDLFEHLSWCAYPQIALLSERLGPMVTAANALLPARARYSPLFVPSSSSAPRPSETASAKAGVKPGIEGAGTYRLNAQQIRIICEVLTSEGTRPPQKSWTPALAGMLQRVAEVRSGIGVLVNRSRARNPWPDREKKR